MMKYARQPSMEGCRAYGVESNGQREHGAANRLPLFTTNPDDFAGLEIIVPVVPVSVPPPVTAPRADNGEIPDDPETADG